MTDWETWEKELRDAGWKPHTYRGREHRYVWVCPNGQLFRGPYGAWRMMKSLEQWGHSETMEGKCQSQK